jgi:hypothetical protein
VIVLRLKSLLREKRIGILVLLILTLGGFAAYLQFFESSVLTADYRFRIPFDEALINDVRIQDSESILFIGHAYGSPFDEDGVPSRTLINNIDALNALEPNLVVLLGDVAKTSDVLLWNELDDNFLSQINSPIIIAPGNHDLEDRELYQDEFGQTYYYTTFANNLIVILDTIIDDCKIIGRQRKMLTEALQYAANLPEIERVLIFTHRLVFIAPSHPLARYENRMCFTTNFQGLVENILSPVAQHKPIYIFSGDVGAFGGGGNLSPFFYQHPNENITAIAVGLGNGMSDKVILANQFQSGLKFQVISLTSEEVLPLEEYNEDYWMNKYELLNP